MMYAFRRFSCPSFFYPSTNRRIYKLLSSGLLTPLTQKVFSSSNGQLRDGEPGTPCLIFVLNGNTLMADGTFMADDALDQSGKGATPECRSWSASTSSCASRSSSTAVPRVRSVRASSISLSGRRLPTRASSRNSRRHSTRYIEAPANDGGIGPAAREKQRSDPRSHRNRSVECLSAYSKKAWLSRIEKAAHFESIFPIHLIACSSRSSRRLTTFWSHV